MDSGVANRKCEKNENIEIEFEVKINRPAPERPPSLCVERRKKDGMVDGSRDLNMALQIYAKAGEKPWRSSCPCYRMKQDRCRQPIFFRR